MYKIAKMGALALAVAMSAPAFAADVAAPTVPAGTQVAAHKGVRHHGVRRAGVKKAAPAREWKQPARWSYTAKRMHAPKGKKWAARWDDLGREGWELVGQEENIYIFKRPADFGWTPPADTPAVATPAAAVTKTKAAPHGKKGVKKVH